MNDRPYTCVYRLWLYGSATVGKVEFVYIQMSHCCKWGRTCITADQKEAVFASVDDGMPVKVAPHGELQQSNVGKILSRHS